MSRTADAPCWSKPRAITRLIFCALIICLAIHFLVEDALLYAELASLRPSGSSAEQVDYEEFEHLDDLALAETALPAWGLDSSGSSTFAWNTPVIRQAHFSIFNPPKI